MPLNLNLRESDYKFCFHGQETQAQYRPRKEGEHMLHK